METTIIKINNEPNEVDEVQTILQPLKPKPFIEANTTEASLEEIRNNHIIPVYVRDNETAIGHSDFIESLMEVTGYVYGEQNLTPPEIRLSHPIQGRIPEAKNKAANELEPWEKTLYYERMMFLTEIPSIYDDINGQHLSLAVGGVKSFTWDNHYGKRGGDETFKVFAGFKVSVCSNLCVWSDGFATNIKVKNVHQLSESILQLLQGYNAQQQMDNLKFLNHYSLSEDRFSYFIGRLRMYQFLSQHQRAGIEPLMYGDQQINSVCKGYYRDKDFCREEDGSVSLWKIANLLTEANKTSYIDSFVDRSINAIRFVNVLKDSLQNKSYNWFLN
jgi:hypothetical protein